MDGRTANSRFGADGTKLSLAATRTTGASNEPMQFSAMRAATSAPKPAVRVSSCATITRFVLRTLSAKLPAWRRAAAALSSTNDRIAVFRLSGGRQNATPKPLKSVGLRFRHRMGVLLNGSNRGNVNASGPATGIRSAVSGRAHVAWSAKMRVKTDRCSGRGSRHEKFREIWPPPTALH